VFLIPGLTSTDETGYIRNTITAFKKAGYQVVLINYRGLAGCELATPQAYNSYAYKDIEEPMNHVYHKCCGSRKVYAIGCSMGANILANMMGH
jgi:predicted alpha/beta-fold hydrolase